MFLQGKENVSQAADDRKEKKALPAALSPQNVFGSDRRTFFLPPLRAGLTVEAACILPLFLWAVLAALYLIEVSVVQVRLVGGIHEAGRKMALLSYGIYGGTSEEEKGTGVGEVVGGALTAVYAKNLILKKAELGETLLKENVKVSLVTSDFSDKDIIDLRVMSRIQLPIPVYRLRGLKFLERGRVRAWTGRSPSNGSGDGDENDGLCGLKRQRLSPGSGLQLYQGEGPLCLCGGDGPQEKLGRFQILCLQLLRSPSLADSLLYALRQSLSWLLKLQRFEADGPEGSVILSQCVESLLKMWITFRKKREEGGK